MTTFKIVITIGDYSTEVFQNASREEALQFVESRLETGTFLGRKFEKVALHAWQSVTLNNTALAQIIPEKAK